MSEPFDLVVIGSGFGGSVAACRMAERGQRVLVLERGRRWDPSEYPSVTHRDWVYDADHPERENGWIDMRFFEDMIVVQGAAVGGGSLIYANVSVEAPKQTFEEGWPEAIDHESLGPHFETAGQMLSVQTIPQDQRTRRWRLVEEGARKLGHEARFFSLPLAVSFDPQWSYDLPDPFDHGHSRPFTNAQGQQQGTCVHLGECDIGCPVRAKNTLDLNYLARAESKGAEIRPLHLARRISPEGSAWRVDYDELRGGQRRPGSVRAERVALAAGSLGSTELLLRCRNQYRTLPRLSARLGRGWSPNGDFLTPAFHDREVRPTEGPTISAAIDHLDGEVYGHSIFLQDGGFPDLLRSWLDAKLAGGVRRRRFDAVLTALRRHLQEAPPLEHVMPWFAQGIDASDGRLHLRRRFWLFGRRILRLAWDIDRSEATIQAIVRAHTELARQTGGRVWVPPTWELLRNLVSPHPLGGCNMADDAQRGVVDHRGEVFGYERLHVVDGAAIPRAIGRNPSRTIAAVAEHAVSHW